MSPVTFVDRIGRTVISRVCDITRRMGEAFWKGDLGLIGVFVMDFSHFMSFVRRSEIIVGYVSFTLQEMMVVAASSTAI